MRKILSSILVAVMVLGLVGTAFAGTASTVAPAKFSDIAGNDAEAAITLLGVKSILKGDAGATTVRPDATISRVEFAAMVIRMLGKDTLATSLQSIKPTTKDEIPAWAWGYVNLAVSMGIMKGDPDGSFRPTANVTFAEALAMLERSIGYESKAVGTWPTKYLVVAYDLGLDDGVDVFADVPATRGDVAIMMVNTMYTPKFLGIKDDGTDNLTAAILAATTVEGMVTAVNPTANTITLATIGDKTLATSVSLAGAAKFSDLVNVNVKMVLVSSKVVYIEVTDSANVIAGNYSSIVAPTATDTNTYIKLTNGNKYPIAAAVTGKLNTTALADWADVSAAFASKDPIIMNLVDDEVVYVEINRVNLQNYTVSAAATTADDVNYDIIFKNTSAVATNSFKATSSTPVTIDGVAKTVADLKANDVVYVSTVNAAIAADTNIISIEAFRATVKGEVTAVKVGSASTTVTLKLADGTSKDLVLSTVATPSVGDTVVYRLNKAGEARVVVGYSATTNVGYVVDFYTTTNATTTTYNVKFDIGGTESTLQVATSVVYDQIDAADTDAFLSYTTDITGKVNAVTVLAPTTITTSAVAAVDKVNGIVTVRLVGVDGDLNTADDTFLTFGIDGLVVYQDNGDGTFTSIGTAGLTVGDLVSFQDATHLNLLVRNDQ